MKPTEVLKQEHRVIEQVLNCLEVIADRAKAGERLETDSAAKALEFFRVFADRCHHGKEEDLLFPLLESKGFSVQEGPTSVMRQEHVQGRGHIAAMAQAIEVTSPQDESHRMQFVKHAQAYIQMMRQHIEKEDHCLFAMADQALDDSEQLELMQRFDKIEHEDLGLHTHENFVQVANELAARFGVPQVATGTGCCCGHDPSGSPDS